MVSVRKTWALCLALIGNYTKVAQVTIHLSVIKVAKNE